MVVNAKFDQQRAEDDLYTVLKFKGKGDFERRIRELLVNDYKKLKKPLSKLLGKLESEIRTDKENKQAARNVYDQIKKSRTNEDKLSNLLEFKKQLKAFLKNQDDYSIVLNAINSASVIPVIEVNGVHPKDSEIKKLKKAQPLTSNRQDFEEALEYIESQEEVMGITLEELMEYKQHSVKIFLLNRVNSCRNGCSQLRPDVREAIAILSNDKLRAFYDEEVKKKTLQPILSYRECEQLYDKINHEKNESRIIIEREELGENVRKVMGVKRFMSESSGEDQKDCASLTEAAVDKRQDQKASNNSELIENSGISSLDSSINVLSDMSVPSGFDINLINSSTPIKQIGQSNHTSTSEDPFNEADLSGKMNLSGASRMVEPMKLIVDRLNKVEEILEQQNFTSLSRELTELKMFLQGFFNVVEELISESGKKCLQNESGGNFENSSGDFLQQIYRLKFKLEIQGKMNCSLDQRNELLIEENLKLVEKNKVLLNRNNLIENQLRGVLEERDRLCASIEEREKDKNKLIAENEQLKWENDELNKREDYTLIASETKSIAIQTENISKSGEITQSDVKCHGQIEQEKLIEEIDIMKEQIEELLSERIILLSNVELLKAENKRLENVEKSLSAGISHFCSVENLYNELAAIEKRGKLDNSTQNEMEAEVGTEAMVPTKNVDLVNVKQGYSKRASNLSRVSEQSSAVKSQFSEARAQSRKQIIYAASSFILSGAFAVGISLTTSHLGVSITLAFTALTLLTLGCYCSYKASTTLRNIQLDQTFKMADHEAVFMFPSL
ncbi:hypothetical protein [Wolbachia endosymbiont (group A) of Rhorus exstirpatorius]|uniref:TomO hydrophobic C-terminal domain-containing protein n=1 Tax=Wolbachia endosymbiont (group A) of Rhorus exstirpatorius TaxID=3066213 RepID=UPI0033413D56